MLTTSSPSRSRTWLRALPVDVEQHVAPFGEHLLHRLARRAIAVAVHLGRFEQFARRLHPLEFAPVDEVIVDAVDFGRAPLAASSPTPKA